LESFCRKHCSRAAAAQKKKEMDNRNKPWVMGGHERWDKYQMSYLNRAPVFFLLREYDRFQRREIEQACARLPRAFVTAFGLQNKMAVNDGHAQAKRFALTGEPIHRKTPGGALPAFCNLRTSSNV
jgi:CO dehydrogenase/acetyl-CoA synthase gamma subunit (corrinoid Fe-S protein)